MAAKDFVVAIELGSSKVTAIAGQKKQDGSISVLAVVREPSSSFIRKGVVYNIDKTAQCLSNMLNKLEAQLKTEVTQVFVGLGGQSVRSVRNVVAKDLPADTKVTQEMVVELMDANHAMEYPDQEILDVADQEYRVGQQLQMEPVGIQTNRLEGNYLNILERKVFYKNLNECFEAAGINVVEFYLAPLALANGVLTEAEKRSGCALVDIGADTTTVSVFTKNILRHLVVIPLGSNNITKDICSLQMDEADAEKMKLKYGSAYTESNEIDPTLKYPIDPERQIESSKFIEIVEGRVQEIVENVWCLIPTEYQDKLLGGIVLTGGGANMKNMEKAFRNRTHIEKIRTAKFVNQTINSSHELIKNHNCMMNTILGLVIKCNHNCAGNELDPAGGDLFSQQHDRTQQPVGRRARQAIETDPGVIRSQREKEQAEEEARKKKEEEERKAREAAEQAAAEAARLKKENSTWNRIKRKLRKFGEDIVKEEE